MALCPKCGVEIADEKKCPLCGIDMNPEASEQPMGASVNTGTAMSGGIVSKHIVALEVISVSMGMAALSLIIVDLIVNRHISWSVYPLSSLAFAWLIVCLPIVFRKKPLFMVPPVALAPFGFLFALDVFDGKGGWFLTLALPITAAVELAGGAAAIVSYFSKRRGLNVVAYGLLAATAVCMVTEASISLFALGTIKLVWSSIVGFALIPVSAFLIYLHHRIAKTTTLKKMFHL